MQLVIVIPYQVSETEYEIVIVAQVDNLERMKEHDPLIVDLNKFPTPWRSLRLRRVIVACEDEAEILRMFKKGSDMGDALRWIFHGFKFRPEKGDNDKEYERLE